MDSEPSIRKRQVTLTNSLQSHTLPPRPQSSSHTIGDGCSGTTHHGDVYACVGTSARPSHRVPAFLRDDQGHGLAAAGPLEAAQLRAQASESTSVKAGRYSWLPASTTACPHRGGVPLEDLHRLRVVLGCEAAGACWPEALVQAVGIRA